MRACWCSAACRARHRSTRGSTTRTRATPSGRSSPSCGGFEPKAGYAQRLASLRAAGIALWDVLASCERQGSLDSDIAVDSMHINDFAEFLREHDRICAVLCNGATAHRLFVRNALPTLVGRDLAVSRLPSTSPAHASMAFEDKLRLWRNALAPHLR